MILKVLIRLVQLAFALTFVFSGMAKCIDPAGTAIKMGEYLQYFGFDASLVQDVSMPLAWVLCLVEFLCGIQLLLGHGMKLSLTLASLMMLAFTPLTLWLALHDDAIQDCGCFGDVVHLSNMATFVKNVVLDLMLVSLWVCRRRMYTLAGKTYYTLYKYSAMVGMALLCYIGTTSEPFIDFRPFTPGTDLRQSVLGSQHAADAKPTYTFIYQLNGHQEEFDIDHLPDEAEGWEFVDTIEHAPQATADGEPQQIQHIDFFVRDAEGELVTRDLLEAPGYTFLLLSASLNQASQHDIDRIEKLVEYCGDNAYPFYCVTSRDDAQYNQWKYNTGAEYPFVFTDVTVVQTICRSNPCVMLLNDGVICWKQPLSELDTEAITTAKLNEQSSGEIVENAPFHRFSMLMILLFAPILLYLLVKIPQKVSIISTKKDSKDA